MVWFSLDEAVSRKSTNEKLADWVENRPKQKMGMSDKELDAIPLSMVITLRLKVLGEKKHNQKRDRKPLSGRDV